MQRVGYNVADIHFSRIALSSQERKPHVPQPLPIELELEKNKKKEPKKYAQELREKVVKKSNIHSQGLIKRQAA